MAATKGAILGAISGLEFGVVTAGVNKLIYGDSYSLNDAAHDIGKSIFSGALTGAITGGAVEAGKQLWSKVGGKITSALERIVKKSEKSKNNPLENIEYTDKVLKQMQQGDYHSFPDSVTAFGDMASAEQIVGGDDIARMKYEIGGSYKGKNGVFQFIIEPDGYTCNHRLFIPSK